MRNFLTVEKLEKTLDQAGIQSLEYCLDLQILCFSIIPACGNSDQSSLFRAHKIFSFSYYFLEEGFNADLKEEIFLLKADIIIYKYNIFYPYPSRKILKFGL